MFDSFVSHPLYLQREEDGQDQGKRSRINILTLVLCNCGIYDLHSRHQTWNSDLLFRKEDVKS